MGLIDYGMVGRLAVEERRRIASTVCAFVEGNDERVVEEYRSSGYRAGWITAPPSVVLSTSSAGTYDHSNATLYRFAKFHLDRIDLSPILVATKQSKGGGGGGDSTTSGEDTDTKDIVMVPWPVLKLLSKSMEFAVPDWIEQMKRIGGLLIGVASQAGRPISLSKEWYSLAKRCLAQQQQHHHPSTNDTETDATTKKKRRHWLPKRLYSNPHNSR